MKCMNDWGMYGAGAELEEHFQTWQDAVGQKDGLCAYYTQNTTSLDKAGIVTAKAWTLVQICYKGNTYDLYFMVRGEGAGDHVWYVGAPHGKRHVVDGYYQT